MPTGKDIRAKNERNARLARQGKTKPRPAYAERSESRRKASPLPPWALAIVVFVVCGGVVFELLRLFFVK